VYAALGLAVAFDSLAMGNFPYPSSYMTSGAVDLPAWPVRAACEHLAGELPSNESLLAAVRDAANVFYNATQDQQCFKLPTLWDIDGIWDYQYCTEMLPQETYFSTDGEHDMFWPRSVPLAQIQAHCREQWRVDPDPDWIRASYGDELLRGASNIVFSNGLLDPWSAAGVREVPKDARGVVVLPIEEGAHHLDLFFSRPALDPPSVVRARKVEVDNMRKWIDEFVQYK
jgi:lysosomal Pro-X carboxypeptidase